MSPKKRKCLEIVWDTSTYGSEIMSSEFAEDLKAFFRDLLRREFGDDIRKDIRDFRENMIGLRKNPNYYKALERILDLIVTNSWWRPLPRDVRREYERQISAYHGKFGDDGFRTDEGKEKLSSIVNRFATSNRKKAVRKISKLIEILIDRDITISDWTKSLYGLAKDRKTEILGDKGRDNYLRDFGYFDRAPLDRHEWRFIVRTGIFHCYAKRDESDPQDRDHLQAALVNFCNKQLEGFEVEEINNYLGQRLDLGKNAGMVDLFIWSYNADERYHICGKTPRCRQCSLNGSCMFARMRA